MDITLFYFGSFVILILVVVGMLLGKERAVMLSFFAGLFGIVFMANVNSSGAFQGLASGASNSIWPAMYIPMFFTIIAFATTAYEGLR